MKKIYLKINQFLLKLFLIGLLFNSSSSAFTQCNEFYTPSVHPSLTGCNDGFIIVYGGNTIASDCWFRLADGNGNPITNWEYVKDYDTKTYYNLSPGRYRVQYVELNCGFFGCSGCCTPYDNPTPFEACGRIDGRVYKNVDVDEYSGGATNIYYRDMDGDGYGDPNNYLLNYWCPPPGYIENNNTDCNDANASINPGRIEICNTIDDNCNGLIDEGLQVTWYPDFDNDGYGNSNFPGYTSCFYPGPGYTSNNLDCNDFNINIYPFRSEICNGIDDNCNGIIDEGFDQDGDGYTTCMGDCDDNNTNIHPGAAEICDGYDNDCDGLIDGDDPGAALTLWFYDEDNDGFGTSAIAVLALCKPTDFVGNSNDCDDENASIHPGAPEICNGIDDNCNGLSDLFDPLFVFATATKWYYDGDNDGYGSNTIPVLACTKPPHYAALAGDCNDANASINPGVTEICNGIDDNCNALIDEGFDLDNDGFTVCAGDCNDADPLINPSASEIYGNATDENCDGLIEHQISSVSGTHGTITPSGNTIITDGTDQLYIITPAIDYSVRDVVIDGSSIGAVTDYTFSTIKGNHSISVTYVLTCNTPPTPDAVLLSQQYNVCNSMVTCSVATVSRATSYNWIVPNGSTILIGQGTKEIVVQFSSTFTTGRVIVTAVNSCGSRDPKNSSLLYGRPTKAIVIGPPCVTPSQKGIAYSVTNPEPGVTYTWQVPSGKAKVVSGQGTPSVIIDWRPTDGYLSVTAANSCGNIKTSYSISTSCAAALQTATGERIWEVMVYPNPTANKTTLIISGTDMPSSIRITDLSGKLLWSKENVMGTRIDLPTQNLANGIYLVTVTNANHKKTIQIVKAQ